MWVYLPSRTHRSVLLVLRILIKRLWLGGAFRARYNPGNEKGLRRKGSDNL